MNLTMLIARFAGQVCARFTAQLQFTSQVRDSIQQINSYAHLWISRVRHALNAGVIHMFDRHDILSCKSPSRAHRKPLRRIACGVAVGLVGSLCLPMGHASSGSIDAIKPKDFIRIALPKKEAICLIRLYGKESAFNPYAIGNLSGKYHTYGIPQLKNAIIYDKSPIEQIRYGLKYIDHRYQGNACNAWNHWLRKGWH